MPKVFKNCGVESPVATILWRREGWPAQQAKKIGRIFDEGIDPPEKEYYTVIQMIKIDKIESASRRTIVDRAVGQIAASIFRGELPFGSRLPPIRRLAEELGVTIPTTQRIVAKLETIGLVTTRHGSGVAVNDPKKSVGMNGFPQWLESVLDFRDVAAKLLDDFLQLRQILAVEMFCHLRPKLMAEDFYMLDQTLTQMEVMVEQGPTDLSALVELDIAIVDRLVSRFDQSAFAMIFNVFAQLLRQVSSVQRAMYAIPAENIAAYRTVFGLMRSELDEPAFCTALRTAIREFDKATVDRFKTLAVTSDNG